MKVATKLGFLTLEILNILISANPFCFATLKHSEEIRTKYQGKSIAEIWLTL